MNTQKLEETAQALVASGRGILAADESAGTIEKRLRAVGVESTEENRRAYRELLFNIPGLGQYISGVILFDETIRQKAHDGTSLVEVLQREKIIPGIKVDAGAKDLAGFPHEKLTEGLDGLCERLAEYAQLGARFAKWRAVITIGPDIPSRTCLQANAERLAEYAALCQEAGLVPIVEPEVLMDGDHTLERCEDVTRLTLHAVFDALFAHKVVLEQMLLKANMVIPGMKCRQQASVPEVAQATLRCLRRAVPPAVPGIVFLSGGQDEIAATQHLNALNLLGGAPWGLSFSYGRALQNSTLQMWGGEAGNAAAAQKIFLHRARCNSAARLGQYTDTLETELNAEPGALAETSDSSLPASKK